MKKCFITLVALALLLPLAACGGNTGGAVPQQQNAPATAAPASEIPATSAPETAEPAPPANAPQSGPGEIAPAEDGRLTLGKQDVVIVINGTAVPLPYRLPALEAAGVPADESRAEIKLGAGDFFSANLCLDEKEDYLICPAYYNGGDAPIGLAEAEAGEIAMLTYADEPQDQGVSLLGVSFGMPKREVYALLGEPMWDEGDYSEWQVAVPDAAYSGSFYIYFTDAADDAGAVQIDLSLIPD